MRILLSTDTVGGVWDYTETLAAGLRAEGHQVLLAVLGHAGEARLSRLPPGVEVVERAFALEWMPDAAEDVAAARAWLCREAERWRPDVVHLNQMAYGDGDFGAPTLVVVHSDVLSWFDQTIGCDAPPEWGGYARWVRAGLHGADVVAAPSAYQSSLALRHYGRGADRVIYNGIRPGPAVPPRAEPVVLTVGRAWDDAKGIGVLDEALGILGAEAPPAHLLGEESGPHGQRFVARHLASHGRCERAAVERWMGAAGIYVAPSRYEPFGLAPLEAALQGCALLLSDIRSFRELWDGCAEFFPSGDAAALAEALGSLAADPGRRAAMARHAREWALARYTADRFVHEYLELYAAMARGHAPSSPV